MKSLFLFFSAIFIRGHFCVAEEQVCDANSSQDCVATVDCTGATEWEAIVVGAGLAGSIVAAKLAEGAPDKCILVIEGGKDSGQVADEGEWDVTTSRDLFFETGWEHVHKSPETVWNTPGTYDTMQCWALECDYVWKEGPLYVAKIVGGGGAINGALMQYPPDKMWASYPTGWEASVMKEYLDEIEAAMKPTRFPSSDGLHYNDDLGSIQVKAAMREHGWVESDEAAYFKPVNGTMGIPKVTVEMGRRASSTSVFLKTALEKKNVQLWTETEALKILLDASNSKATGVQVKRGSSSELEEITLAEDGLLVLSAGGVKTPQLLLKSDIGPTPDSKVSNAAVGKGISDKAISWTEFKLPTIKSYDLTSPPLTDQHKLVEKGSGPLTQFGPLLVGFIMVEGEPGNLVEFFVSKCTEDGKVKVWLVHLTPKPDTNSALLYNDTIVGGLQDADYTSSSFIEAKNVVKAAMNRMGYEHSADHPWFDQMNHPGSSCQLGTCIDGNTLLVKGLDNVAAVDNSIVPEQSPVHTAMALQAIALRASDILLERIK